MRRAKQARPHNNTLLPIFLSLCVSHCTTSNNTSPNASAALVEASTIVSADDSWRDDLIPSQIILPKNMVTVAYVVRSTAELRVGPGTQFKLKDNLLSEGSTVVVFDRIGPWQKVMVPEIGETGWVHHVTLGKMKLNAKPITIRSGLLPRVFATRDLNTVYGFKRKGRDALAASIPKGTSFAAIRYAEKKVLVYLPATNSVAWLDGKVVQ